MFLIETVEVSLVDRKTSLFVSRSVLNGRHFKRSHILQEGSITIGGVDVRELNVHKLREQIGVVSQEPILFDTSIAENIKWGGVDITHDQMVSAAKQANAYNFIMELPDVCDMSFLVLYANR